jgi:hypothetical protein
VGQTIKRRVRVNRGLWVRRQGAQVIVDVVSTGEPLATGHEREGQWITHGMLCAGYRAGQRIIGIVNAIHSSGRVSLLTLEAAHQHGMRWHPVVVSPRQNLRVLSTDRVVLLPADRSTHGREPGAEETDTF